ncbi:hypothetical protein F8M41_010071 [Gigaspora margarita]|uniref:Uncharacterized protein n=1 Tax=Gigaspora margarita TaxID=4874 RepID=A0A8H3X1K7_GIGMA|nr:hypothetical protein F8M41_010071 [Gigaspora margarita]
MDDTKKGTIGTKKIYKEFKYNISQIQDSRAIVDDRDETQNYDEMENKELNTLANAQIKRRDETDYQNAATGKSEDKEGAETESDYENDIEDEEN